MEQMIFCQELVKIFAVDGRKVMALQGLDFEVEAGEEVAIIGKSGSGKSTLLNLLGALEFPTAGRISVQGKELGKFSEREAVYHRRRTVGFVRQSSGQNLFSCWNVLQNIECPMLWTEKNAKKRRNRAMELLERLHLAHYACKYPTELSGGEQQRIAIAVALANKPSLLLADEPTGAVDTTTAGEIFDLFHLLNEEWGMTIVIVSHDPGISRRVPRTVQISDGKISMESLSHGQDTFVVMDGANRLQLSEEILAQAGIHGRRVRVEAGEGMVILR